MKTRQEIEDQIDKALESKQESPSRLSGMTYEEGVDAALRWVLGDAEYAPMDE
jgi:hypothetical protein